MRPTEIVQSTFDTVYQPIKNSFMEVVHGPQRTLEINSIHVGPERYFRFIKYRTVPTGYFSGGGESVYGTGRGRDVGVIVTRDNGVVHTQVYTACRLTPDHGIRDFTEAPIPEYTGHNELFPEDALESLLFLEGKTVEIRMRNRLPNNFLKALRQAGSEVKK